MQTFRVTITQRNGSKTYSVFSDEHGRVTLPYSTDVIDGDTGDIIVEDKHYHDTVNLLDLNCSFSKYGCNRASIRFGAAYHNQFDNYFIGIGHHVSIEIDWYDTNGNAVAAADRGTLWTGIVESVDASVGDEVTVTVKGSQFMFKGMEVPRKYTFNGQVDVTTIFSKLILDVAGRYFATSSTSYYFQQLFLRSLRFDKSNIFIENFVVEAGVDLWGVLDRLSVLATNLDQTFIWGVERCGIKSSSAGVIDQLYIEPYFYRVADHTETNPVFRFELGNRVRTLIRTMDEKNIVNQLRIFYGSDGENKDFNDSDSINTFGPFPRRKIYAGGLSNANDAEKLANGFFVHYSDPEFVNVFKADLPSNINFFGTRWGKAGVEARKIFPTIELKYESQGLATGALAQQFSEFVIDILNEEVSFSLGKIPFPNENRNNGDTVPPWGPPWGPPFEPPYNPPSPPVPPGTVPPDNPPGLPPIIVDTPELPPEIEPPDPDNPHVPPVVTVCLSYSALVDALGEAGCSGSSTLDHLTIAGYLGVLGIDTTQSCADILTDLLDVKNNTKSGLDCMDGADGNGYDVGGIDFREAVPGWETDRDNTFAELFECTCPDPDDPEVPTPAPEPACIDLGVIYKWISNIDYLGLESDDYLICATTEPHFMTAEEVSVCNWIRCILNAAGIDASQPVGVILDAIDEAIQDALDVTGSPCICINDISGCIGTTNMPPTWEGSTNDVGTPITVTTAAETVCRIGIAIGVIAAAINEYVIIGEGEWDDPAHPADIEYVNLALSGVYSAQDTDATNQEIFDLLFTDVRVNNPHMYNDWFGVTGAGFDVSELEHRLVEHYNFTNGTTFSKYYERPL